MSQHKTGLSNWTGEDKKLYWQRREKGLRGQLAVPTLFRVIKDEDGNDRRVPIGNKLGTVFSRGKQTSHARANRGPSQAHIQQQRKASSRGV